MACFNNFIDELSGMISKVGADDTERLLDHGCELGTSLLFLVDDGGHLLDISRKLLAS